MIDLKAQNQDFTDLLDEAIKRGASDLHLIAESPPMLRVDGILRAMDQPAYTNEQANDLVANFIGHALYDKIMSNRSELDFSFTYKHLRFRVNVFFEKGILSASLRLLPAKIPTFETLGVPAVAGKLLEHNQGMIIISGPTGHGKSTTLAAMIDILSATRHGHIITIEDPIEYIFEHKKSIVTQREVGSDTPSFSSALRASLREDPDIVLLGEMRDQETMEVALQIAETGHLVLTTLHTNSAAQTANRIVDVFPPHQQDQVRIQLSEVLLGVIAQRLLPKIQGGRVLASEVMIVNSAVRSLVREGKTHQLPNLIQTSAAEGMVSLDHSLADLVSRGEITLETALSWSIDPKALRMLVY
jgi:twitching motility protein PilT